MAVKSRRARVEDVHELAMGMPHVSVEYGPGGNAIYQVGGKSFVFFRNPRPDAVDSVICSIPCRASRPTCCPTG